MVFLYCGAAEECKHIEIEGLIVEDNHVLWVCVLDLIPCGFLLCIGVAKGETAIKAHRERHTQTDRQTDRQRGWSMYVSMYSQMLDASSKMQEEWGEERMGAHLGELGGVQEDRL
jgi:hypothetical protein